MSLSSSATVSIDYKQILSQHGCVKLDSQFTESLLTHWHLALDSFFSQNQQNTVGPTELYNLGILQGIFSPEIKKLLQQFMPNAIFYQCRACEYLPQKANECSTTVPFKGWARDAECVSDFGESFPTRISLVIYLTNTEECDGPFEVRPQSPYTLIRNGEPTHKILGSMGTTFLLNRAMFHRRLPNLSHQPHRFLELTFQPVTAYNKYIWQPEFKHCLALSEGDPYFEHLFGKEYGQSFDHYSFLPHQSHADLPAILEPKSNGALRLGPFMRAKMNTKILMSRFTR